MKRISLLLPLLAAAAGAVWLAARGCGADADAGDPVERLVEDMVPIPGRDYRMGKHEVTQAQWEAVMGENPSVFKGLDHPVENVSWDDCQAFLEKLNAHPAARASGLDFRLPTNEEWTFAARGGSTNDYCRLDDGTEITDKTLNCVAWHGEKAFSRPDWLHSALDSAEKMIEKVHPVDLSEPASTHHPVGRKKPNAYGLHDMLGNVAEWTGSGYGRSKFYYIAGGEWHSAPEHCRSTPRDGYANFFSNSFLGFRLCATPSPAAPALHAESAEGAKEPAP